MLAIGVLAERKHIDLNIHNLGLEGEEAVRKRFQEVSGYIQSQTPEFIGGGYSLAINFINGCKSEREIRILKRGLSVLFQLAEPDFIAVVDVQKSADCRFIRLLQSIMDKDLCLIFFDSLVSARITASKVLRKKTR